MYLNLEGDSTDPVTLLLGGNITKKEIMAAVKAGTLTQSQFNAALESAGKGLISKDDLRKILGLKFSGMPALEKVWNDMINAAANGVSPDQAQAAYKYTLIQLSKSGVLPKDVANSALLQGALLGIQDPRYVSQAAQALADKLIKKYKPEFSKLYRAAPKVVEMITRHQYIGAWQAADAAVLPLLTKSPKARAIYGAGSAATTAGIEIAARVKQYEKTGSIDASGVIAIVGVVQDLHHGITSLARTFGGNKKVLNTVDAWADVGAACVSAIAAGASTGNAAGYVAGGLSCAITIASQIIAELEDKPPPGSKMALCHFTPSKNQTPAVALDAQRLAMLLKAHYGVRSYKEINDQFTDGHDVGKWLASYPGKNERKTLPGFSPYHMLRIFGPSWHYLSELTYFASKQRSAVEERQTDMHASGLDLGWDLDEIYRSGYDLNVPAIKAMAWHEASGGRLWKDHARGGIISSQTKLPKVTFRNAPALALSELIEFFAAITAYEAKRTPGLLAVWDTETEELPIRMWGTCTSSRGNPEDGACGSDYYNTKCWTALDMCEDGYTSHTTSSTGMTAWCSKLYDHVVSSQHLNSYPRHSKLTQCRIRELAFIRLRAAMSYLHMSYRWGRDTTGKNPTQVAQRRDPISAIQLDPKDPMFVLMTPINPRSKYDSKAGYYVTPDFTRHLATMLQLDRAVTKMKRDIDAAVKRDREKYKNQLLEATVARGLQRQMALITSEGPGALMAMQQDVQRRLQAGEIVLEQGPAPAAAPKATAPAETGGAAEVMVKGAGAGLFLWGIRQFLRKR